MKLLWIILISLTGIILHLLMTFCKSIDINKNLILNKIDVIVDILKKFIGVIKWKKCRTEQVLTQYFGLSVLDLPWW